MGLCINVFEHSVENLSLREAITLPPQAPVREAIKLMRARKLGCVVIVNEEGKPLGTFTENSLIELLAGDPKRLDSTVDECRSWTWASVTKTDSIADVLDKMHLNDIRFVVVTDAAGRAVALTGQRGLVEYVADYFPQTVQSMVGRTGASHFADKKEGE